MPQIAKFGTYKRFCSRSTYKVHGTVRKRNLGTTLFNHSEMGI